MIAIDQPIGKNSDDRPYWLSMISIDTSNYSFQILHICLVQCARLVIKEERIEPQVYMGLFSMQHFNFKF